MADVPRQPTLRLIGFLLVSIVALALAGLSSSVVIGRISQGMAAAINQSGTLRMQSYRIAAAVLDTGLSPAARRARVRVLVAEFEERLNSPRLTAMLGRADSDPVNLAYARVHAGWSADLRPTLAWMVATTAAEPRSRELDHAYLDLVDVFVDDIHTLVQRLEDRAELRIWLLQLLQVLALGLTLCLVLVTLLLLRRQVIGPLADLLCCAEQVRQGDFSARVAWTGNDELGRLGASMNRMTQDLSRLYHELEARIAAKTQDLARSNRSLELLYRTSRRLEEVPLAAATLHRVLRDLRDQFALAKVVLCLRDGLGISGLADLVAAVGSTGVCLDTTGRARAQTGAAAGPNAPSAGASGAPGANAASVETAEAPGAVWLDLVVGEPENRYGTLRACLHPGQALAPWEQRLLTSVAAHLATACKLQARVQEGRRLVLHEERSSLARELHDSLAQSLSYLKIQAARLGVALGAASAARPLPTEAGGTAAGAGSMGRDAHQDSALDPARDPAVILAEMRSGLASAYRQLRELLGTFRLRIDGSGLAGALTATVQEYRDRGDLDIGLTDQLPLDLLSANEEVHVLQIVREALSNVVRHARASHATVQLQRTDDGAVAVVISDDGIGLGRAPPGRGHYGLMIMRERAVHLGGTLAIGPDPVAGTRVCLRFQPRAGRRHAYER